MPAPTQPKRAPAKKAAPVKKATPTKKATAVKKAAPAKKTAAAAKKTAPAKKSVPAKKAAPTKKASPAKKATAAKKTVAAKKVAAKKVAPAKKTATKKTTAAPRPRKQAAPAAVPTVTVQNVAEEAPAGTPTPDARWRGHLVAAHTIRAIAVSVPVAASVMSGVLFSHLVHRPDGGKLVLWWLATLAASTAVLVVVDRLARRLLPLATLLKLSMAFPDQAPSRFLMAARAGTTRKLQEQLQRAQDEGMDDEPVVAAQRILTLVGALGVHDRRTRGHSERVRAFNDLIAQELRLPQHDRDRLRWAALLHDIGKLHVPTKILNKPKKPTEKEWAVLKSHPARGARITAPLSSWLGPWADTIEQHHERWDGAGYPNNLSGADISLGARIVAVADAYEVMTAPRPYSRPVSAAAAREELARCAGAQFDPEVVRAFLNISIGKLRKVIGPISWLAQLPLIGATPKLEVTVGNAGRQVVSAAAAATGTGVVAAAMLPQAAHAPQHHEQLVLSAGAATVQTQTHAAAPTSPSRPVVPHAPAASHPTAAKAPAVTSHVVRASATNVATVHKSSSPTTTHTDSSSPTRPQGMPAKPVTAPRPSQPTTKTSKPTPPTAHDPAPAPAPPDDPKPAPPPKDPKPDPAPTPTSSTDSGSGGHDDPQPDHGNDDDAGHGHGN